MDIEKKALELEPTRQNLANAAITGGMKNVRPAVDAALELIDAMADKIQADNARHAAELDAFRREVSEAATKAQKMIELYAGEYAAKFLSDFIISQPDPLVDLAREMVVHDGITRTKHQQDAIRSGKAGQAASADLEDRLRAALAARGLELVKKEPSQ